MRALWFVSTVICAVMMSAATSNAETKVLFLSDCPKTAAKVEFTGIEVAAFLLPKVIDISVDLGVGAIKAAGEKTETITTKSISNSFYKFDPKGTLEANPSIGCIAIIQGPYGEQIETNSKLNDLKQLLQDNHIKDVNLYLESNLQSSQDGRSFRLVPKAFYSSNYSGWSKKRDFLISFTFSKPSATDKTIVGSTSLSFKDVEEGTLFKYVGEEDSTTWMPLPPLDTEASKDISEHSRLKNLIPELDQSFTLLDHKVKGTTSASLPAGIIKDSISLCEAERKTKNIDPECKDDPITKDKFKLEMYRLTKEKEKALNDKKLLESRLAKNTPFNLELSIVETKNPNQFFKKLAEALDKNKDDIKSVLKEQVPKSSEEKKKQELEKQKTKDSLMEKVDQAEIEVKTTAKELTGATTADEKSIAELKLRIAKRKVNAACREADIAERYEL